jgi:hypothetical protein
MELRAFKKAFSGRKIVPEPESEDAAAAADEERLIRCPEKIQIRIAAARGPSAAQPAPGLWFHTHRPAWAAFSNDNPSSRVQWAPVMRQCSCFGGLTIMACAISQDQKMLAIGMEL